MIEFLPLLQYGGCFEEQITVGCVLEPYTLQMGSVFVLAVVLMLGGGFAIYQRSPAPLLIVGVVVGVMSIGVLPAIAVQGIYLVAIGGAVGALVYLYRNIKY